MPKLVPVLLPVDGPMDTTGPASNREPGVLVDSTDCDHRWWGPRTCLTQQTWPYQSAASFPNRYVPIYDGNLSFTTIPLDAHRQQDLLSSWTLDVVVRPSGISHSASDGLPIFIWTVQDGVSGIQAVRLNIRGPGAAAGVQRTFQAVVIPTTSAGVAGTTVTLNGATQVAMGTAIENTYHVRLVRDESTLSLYVNGTLDATTTTSNLGTYRHEGSVTGFTNLAYIGGNTSGANNNFAGRVYSVLMRDGAHTTLTDGFRDFMFPFGQEVRLAVYGSMGLTSNGKAYEQSKYHMIATYTACAFSPVPTPEPWTQNSVQGMAHFSDIFGRSWNVVVAGGTLFWRKVQ